jgi:hypothetical protein
MDDALIVEILKRRTHCHNFASPAHRISSFRFSPSLRLTRPSFRAQRCVSIEPRQTSLTALENAASARGGGIPVNAPQ